MPRNVSVQFKEDVHAQETGEVYATLLKIEHADLPQPLLVCDQPSGVTLSGETYTYYPFTIALPDDRDGAMPEVQLQLSDIGVDRNILAALRTIDSPPTLRIFVGRVPPGGGDVEVEYAPLPFVWRALDYDAATIQGVLKMDQNFLDEAYPGHFFLPADGFGSVL